VVLTDLPLFGWEHDETTLEKLHQICTRLADWDFEPDPFISSFSYRFKVKDLGTSNYHVTF
jgi:hypothetical protein